MTGRRHWRSLQRPGQVSLARALSKLGFASRSEALRMIAAGRVRVGGRVVTDPAHWLDPDRQRIEVDGVAVRRAATVWLALHKPVGYVTTMADELGRKTVRDLLPPDLPSRVAPVGRLDLESSGLLLLTNDHRAAAAIARPESRCPKIYEVEVDRPLTAADLAAFAAGMQLPGEPTPLRPVLATISQRDPRRMTMTLTEGRNRQIRRMCGTRGLAVRTLHRTAIGPVRLADLPAATTRPLTPTELAALTPDRY
ncbi:MAG: rRNA pseudouridine synthase [Planctomycetes bacterium]|nr:rRNA pseudouridine synthase [Planctomycetota bacterium]